MSSNEIIYQAPYLVEIEFRCSMRIQHRRMIYSLWILLENRFDGERLHVYVRLHQCGKMGWNSPDLNRLDPVFVDDARHFDAAAERQIVDQVVIGNVAIDDPRGAGLHAIDNQ